MKKRICLSISDLDLATIDAIAEKLQISRAELISRMIALVSTLHYQKMLIECGAAQK
jgi:hypothetical protein